MKKCNNSNNSERIEMKGGKNMKSENIVYFWTGMGFLILEILIISLGGLIYHFTSKGIGFETILMYGIGSFVILSLNVLALIFMIKGLR